MSFTINIYYTGKNGSAKQFAEEMLESGIADAVRSEKGNEGYEYFVPLKSSETVLLIDKWKDRESLDLHHSSEIMNSILALRKKYGLSVTAKGILTITVHFPKTIIAL